MISMFINITLLSLTILETSGVTLQRDYSPISEVDFLVNFLTLRMPLKFSGCLEFIFLLIFNDAPKARHFVNGLCMF